MNFTVSLPNFHWERTFQIKAMFLSEVLFIVSLFFMSVFNYCFILSKLFYFTAIVCDYLRCELFTFNRYKIAE